MSTINRLKREADKEKAIELFKNGATVNEIMEQTGLPKTEVIRFRKSVYNKLVEECKRTGDYTPIYKLKYIPVDVKLYSDNETSPGYKVYQAIVHYLQIGESIKLIVEKLGVSAYTVGRIKKELVAEGKMDSSIRNAIKYREKEVNKSSKSGDKKSGRGIQLDKIQEKLDVNLEEVYKIKKTEREIELEKAEELFKNGARTEEIIEKTKLTRTLVMRLRYHVYFKTVEECNKTKDYRPLKKMKFINRLSRYRRDKNHPAYYLYQAVVEYFKQGDSMAMIKYKTGLGVGVLSKVKKELIESGEIK